MLKSFLKKISVDLHAFLLSLAFIFNLRRILIKISRLIRENENEKKVLPSFKTPQEVESHLSKTKYHKDPFSGKWDYVSSAEYMEYKLETHNYEKFPEGPYLGDCDDYAFMVAKLIVLVDSVGVSKLVSIWFTGGAHAVCFFHYKGENFLYDYGIIKVENLKEAVNLVAKKYSNGVDEYPKYYVVENVYRGENMPIFESINHG